MTNCKHVALGIAGMAAVLLFNWHKVSAQDITWKLNNLNLVGSAKPLILGQPAVKNDNGRSAIAFNGATDGLIVPNVPIEGWSKFTIEVLFKPDGDGPVAPRFIHFQDNDGNRGTFEVRLTRDKQWYLDAFLKNGKAGDKGLTLIDSTLLHPADHWYWVAMVFDGKNMQSYVNGIKEKEGICNFPVLDGSAQLSFGVRLNQVSWFKGQISEVRFHPNVLSAHMLQKAQE